MDLKFTLAVLKELYFKRWSIEIKYDELKNRLEIEKFTGTNKIAIEQDFYASIYISNMIELVRSQKNDSIKQHNKLKGLKYEYQTNLNILAGAFKDKFVCMLIEDNSRKRKKIFDSIMKQISKPGWPAWPFSASAMVYFKGSTMSLPGENMANSLSTAGTSSCRRFLSINTNP